MKKQHFTQLIIISLLAWTASCGFTKGKNLAEAAVVRFHNQYNSGEFHSIYAEADEGFRKGDTEANLVDSLKALRTKLGTVKQASQTSWNMNTTPAGTVVTLSYDTEFSEGKATEHFVFHINGDQAFLYSYNVNSPLLITK